MDQPEYYEWQGDTGETRDVEAEIESTEGGEEE